MFYWAFCAYYMSIFNASRSKLNGDYIADDFLKCILLNETYCILMAILLEFVPKTPNCTRSVLVQVMAWCRKGSKPLPGLIMTKIFDLPLGPNELITPGQIGVRFGPMLWALAGYWPNSALLRHTNMAVITCTSSFMICGPFY